MNSRGPYNFDADAWMHWPSGSGPLPTSSPRDRELIDVVETAEPFLME